jgi:tyramine---L-glutamate ligase
LRILLYEHVSSGGFAGEPLPPGLLSEGFGMLRGLTEDFQAVGHEVTVLLDSRIAALHLPLSADHVVQIAASGEADPSMEKAAETVDAAYVVAPEPNHVLQSIVECMETTGTLSLNCQSSGIEQASDKGALADRVRRLGLNFPKTTTFSSGDSSEEIARTIRREIAFPVVIKPANGAGCGGLSLVQNEKQITGAIRKVKAETASAGVTAQEYVKGVPVSVSLIGTYEAALPVSLNLQDITLAPPDGDSSYNGGLVPFAHPIQGETFTAAKRLVESFGNLRGYVGVDMVLTEDKAFVMEVNPRLTTSYVGLRNTANFNVAQAIVNAVLKSELPKDPQHCGYACFSKISTSPAAILDWTKARPETKVVTPPFQITGQDYAFALIQSTGKTPNEASMWLREAKKELRQTMLRELHKW